MLKSDWSDVLVSLVTSLQDRTQSSRAAAEQLFCALLAKNYITRADAAKSFRDLAPATLRALQGTMDRIISTRCENAAPHAAPPPVTTAPEPETKSTVSRPRSEATAASKILSSGRQQLVKPSASTEEAPTARAHASSEAPSTSFPLKRSSKAKRMEDFYKQNWPQPPEDPGAAEMAALKSAWEGLLTPELFDVLFEEVKGGLANQDSVLGPMAELMSLLKGDSVGATSGLQYGTAVGETVIQHTDLILRWVSEGRVCIPHPLRSNMLVRTCRWAALALCLRESSSGLLNILLLVSKVFDATHHVGGQVRDS